MKAIVYHQYGPPDVLALEEVDTPVPGDGDVRIRVRAAVASTADCAARSGTPVAARLVFGLRHPRKTILGTEFAGEIEAVGTGVTRFKAGDRVFAASGTAFGAHAEHIVLPESGALATMPSNVTFEEAAAISEGAMTALPFLRDKGRVSSGQRVLINGASGSVGTAAVQLAKHFGAHVTGVCGTAHLDLVRSLGADEVIDYTQVDFARTGETYDIVFDAVGKSSFRRCAGSLNPRGVYLSTVPGLVISLQSVWKSKFGSKRAVFTATGLRPAADKAKDLAFIRELVEAGALRPVIDRCFPMEQAAGAHRLVETGHKTGSVVLTIGPAQNPPHQVA